MASRYLIGETTLAAGSAAAPESFTKKATRNAALLKEKTAFLTEQKKANKVKRHDMKVRAQKYEKEYKNAANQLIQLRRQAKFSGNFYREPEARTMIVVRITGINKLAPKPRKILKLLRLDQLHKAVFVKCTKPMINMLKCIQPYVICGYPSLKTTKELIMKRGYGRIGNERTKLNDNAVISEKLGKYGIHGMEDLIHEIYTVGPNFKQANNFLWAFKLSSPNGGFVLKKHGFHEPKGGDWGNREELVNNIIKRML